MTFADAPAFSRKSLYEQPEIEEGASSMQDISSKYNVRLLKSS